MKNLSYLKPRIAVHIGYPKCASTTLQEHLFRNHSEINNLSKESQKQKENSFKEFYYNLTHLSSIAYDKNLAFQKYKKEIKPHSDNRKIQMLSDENLLSNWNVDNTLKAERVKELFPSAKIMILIRNQYSFLISLYIYYVRRWFVKDADCLNLHPSPDPYKVLSFEDWLKGIYNFRQKGILEAVNYYENVKLYKNLFGDENVGVFLFEDLVDDLPLFSKQLSGFLGVDYKEVKSCLESKHSNPAFSARYLRALKLKRSLIPFIPIPKKIKGKIKKLLNKGEIKKPELSYGWKSKLRDFYKNSNKKLIQEFGLEIDKYDYPL